MTTDSPVLHSATMQGIPVVRFKATPHLWEMTLSLVVACVVIIGSLGVLTKWYNGNPVKTAESRELHQQQFKMILTSIVENKDTDFTEQEKQMYSGMLQDITYEDVKSLLDGIDKNGDRKNLDLLISNNDVAPGNKVPDLQWNNGSPAQIRFIKRKNDSLDFQKIDVFSAPPDACSSKVIPLGDSSSGTVEVCESHLSKKLEIVVIQNSE